jgi:CRISPR/Cas system CSM-associated protein Csm4 (group 5 of RAMP superfamily)
MNKNNGEFINPVDKDKTAEVPGLMPYAHHVGSAIIKPIDKGKVKGRAMTAMYQQTENQLLQIKEQVENLLKQAQDIHNRIAISEDIYKAEINFTPNIGQVYYLYNKEERTILSLIGPNEWGKKCPYKYLASVKLLADHTWEVVER